MSTAIEKMRIRDQVLIYMSRIVRWAHLFTTDSSRVTFGTTAIDQEALDQSQGEKQLSEPVRILQDFGLRSRPPRGSECIIVAVGGGRANSCVVATDHEDYGPADLQEGDVVVYSGAHMEGATCVIKLLKVGEISATPKSGQKVKLGDTADANLDPIVLYTQLKAQFDAFVGKFHDHIHPAGALLDGNGIACTGSTAKTTTVAATLTTAVQSSNVVAKK